MLKKKQEKFGQRDRYRKRKQTLGGRKLTTMQLYKTKTAKGNGKCKKLEEGGRILP